MTDTEAILDTTMLGIFLELDQNGNIVVSWVFREPAEITSYKITYRDLDTGAKRETGPITSDTYFHTIKDVEKNKKYIVCIEAVLFDTLGDDLIRKCEYISTKPDSNTNLLLIILISAVVVVVAAIVLVACCVIQRRPKKKFQPGAFTDSESRLVERDRAEYFGSRISLSGNARDLSESASMAAPMNNIAYKLPPSQRSAALSGSYAPKSQLDISRNTLYGSRHRLESGSSDYASTSRLDNGSLYSTKLSKSDMY
jgi:hypothetical protein